MKKLLNTVALSIIITLILASCGNNNDPKQAFKSGDFEKSLSLLLPLAEQGDHIAQNYVGVQYALGLGVKRDYKQAAHWFELAAKSGLPDAQRNYGDMFYYGRGVPQNYYESFIWYFAASQQGHQTAKKIMDDMAGNAKLTPNQMMHAKIEANQYIPNPDLRFLSHDTYIDRTKGLEESKNAGTP